MDKLEQYRQWIQALLTEYVATPISNGAIESQTLFDTQRDHYQVTNVGWDGHRRVYGCVLRLDIKDARFGCSRIQRRCESRTSWRQWVWQRMILSWDLKRPMCANMRALGWLKLSRI